MPHRLLAPAAMATLLSLTTAAATAQTSGSMNAERGWSAVSRCAQEDTEYARHACVDRVLRDAGLLTAEMSARQQRNAFGLDERQARAAPAPSSTASSPASTTAPAATAVTTAPAAASRAANEEALNRRAAERAPEKAAEKATVSAAGETTPSADRLEVQLAKVEKAVNGRVFVTTTDGAVWLQTESVEMPQPPVAGDRMTIRKGSMGGYRCSVTSTHLTYRCARNR